MWHSLLRWSAERIDCRTHCRNQEVSETKENVARASVPCSAEPADRAVEQQTLRDFNETIQRAKTPDHSGRHFEVSPNAHVTSNKYSLFTTSFR
jgi:hypothetical protein